MSKTLEDYDENSLYLAKTLFQLLADGKFNKRVAGDKSKFEPAFLAYMYKKVGELFNSTCPLLQDDP